MKMRVGHVVVNKIQSKFSKTLSLFENNQIYQVNVSTYSQEVSVATAIQIL